MLSSNFDILNVVSIKPFYFNRSFCRSRSISLSRAVCASLWAWPSPSVRVISSSMVMSTRSGPFCALSPPSSSPPPLSPLSPPSPQGRSRPSFSLPQPGAQSYFFSLRDSCFFFSEAAEVVEAEVGRAALEGSAVEVWPCG